jgi:hypothetical protein
MAWPYDNGGILDGTGFNAMSLGNYGSSDVFANNGASGAQNVASLYGATGGNSFGSDMGIATTAGMQPAGGGLFSGLGDLLSGAFNKTNPKTGVTQQGWAPLALGAGQAIFGAYQGMQAQKMAQQQFKEGKRQFDLNYGAQRQGINTELEDRQRARVAANPGAYQSVSEYMDKNRIK